VFDSPALQMTGVTASKRVRSDLHEHIKFFAERNDKGNKKHFVHPPLSMQKLLQSLTTMAMAREGMSLDHTSEADAEWAGAPESAKL